MKQSKQVFPIQIDKLKAYYLVSDYSLINQLLELTAPNDCLFIDSFQFRRMRKNVFAVNSQTIDASFEVYATLQTNFDIDNQFQETETKGVWLTYENKTFYDGRFEQLYFKLITSLYLQFNNITKIELALDSTYSINKIAYKCIRNKKLDTIINGKVIDRNEKLDLYFNSTTTANRVLEHFIQVNSKKYAHNSKHKGMGLKSYDKQQEIVDNNNEKIYVLKKYGYPSKLYRLEVVLSGEAAMEYLNRNRIECEQLMFDSDKLQAMYFTHINRLLRWRKGRTIIKWEDLVATAGVM